MIPRDMAIGPSARFVMLLLFLHSITAIIVSATAMPVAARAAAFVLILLSLGYHLARDVLRLFPDSWIALSLDQDGVSVVTRDGRRYSGQIEKKTVVYPHFIVLRITQEGRRLPVIRVIFPDALDDGAFRELCVRLKFA